MADTKQWPYWLRESSYWVSVHKCGQSEARTNNANDRGYARNVITPWGNRTVEITGSPDTYFSQPARLQLSFNGKRYNVPGFLTVKTENGLDTGDVIGLEFHGDTSYVQELPTPLQHKQGCTCYTCEGYKN